jgi:molybdopterin-biosynthesis enzyme MoeA-like protein
METLIRDTWRVPELTPAALRLAEAPEGATLVAVPGTHFPVLSCDGIFMLPGVPKYFAVQLEAVLATLPVEPVTLRCLFLDASEHEIAPALDAVALENAHVAIGSYPVVEPEAGYRVKLTIEHVSADEVAKVIDRLKRELPKGSVISEDEPTRGG